VPAADQANINVADVPYNRVLGETPLLNDQDIDAITAFLRTLTDSDFR
jgi:cytochrome c peroxidase